MLVGDCLFNSFLDKYHRATLCLWGEYIGFDSKNSRQATILCGMMAKSCIAGCGAAW